MVSRIVCAAVLGGWLAAGTAEVALGQGTATATTGGTGGTGGGATVTTQQIAGVAVDADGVLRMFKFADPGGRLSMRRIAEARTTLGSGLSDRSELRKISLNRLEAAIRGLVERRQPIADEMRYLAGLTRVQYVFFYPETRDIVIAGPAEGWATDLSGRVRGIETGRPVVELQDLVVALRCFPPQGSGASVISCSIDPTREGLANMQQFLRMVGPRAVPGQANQIVDGLRRSLGMQNVTIVGVPNDTHFAQVLVEADYRMKLIGLGMERTRVKLKSYVDLASAAAVSRNAMQRWYFVPNYECVRVSDDELAMELVGQGVKLIGADEMVAADGTRSASARGDRAGDLFTQGFTAKYEELAAAVPVYAQLRNCIDLAVAAAFIQKQDYYGQAGWQMEVLGDEGRVPVRTVSAPQRVETAVASVVKGNRLMTPIGGGVSIQARNAMNPENLLRDERGEVASMRRQITLDQLQDGQWWWD
jgi:hypothetical protein